MSRRLPSNDSSLLEIVEWRMGKGRQLTLGFVGSEEILCRLFFFFFLGP